MQSRLGFGQIVLPLRDLRSVGGDIHWHAVELHSGNGRNDSISKLLALLIELVEELLLLGDPEDPAEHCVEGGVLELLRRQHVNGPVGGAKRLGQSDVVVDPDRLLERRADTIAEPVCGHDIVDAASGLDAGLVDQPLHFERRIEDGERQPEQRFEIRPGHGAHVEDVAVRSTIPHLYQPHLRAIGVQSRAGARLLRDWPAGVREPERHRLLEGRQDFGLEIDAEDLRLAGTDD